MSQVSSLNAEEFDALEQLLGYLNFSSGTPDPQFLKNLNVLWQNLAEQYPDDTWTHLYDLLTDAITYFTEEKEAFAQIEQARVVLEITFDQLLRSYFLFHQDLLFHSSEIQLFNAFFIGRAFEVVLQNGPDFQSLDTETLMNQFNDFIGFRPVATLETQKHEPYINEWLRPVPLYIQGAGVCEGPYKEVIALTIRLLEQTDESILRQAGFHPAKLSELAIDPRAYDFDHPVNKRPNHHFGMWDPHHIDKEGYYDRYIIQTVTLDSLMTRFENDGDLSPGRRCPPQSGPSGRCLCDKGDPVWQGIMADDIHFPCSVKAIGFLEGYRPCDQTPIHLGKRHIHRQVSGGEAMCACAPSLFGAARQDDLKDCAIGFRKRRTVAVGARRRHGKPRKI